MGCFLVRTRRISKTPQLGQAAVELALTGPILVVLILGVVELAHALNAYISVTNASREGARLAARGNLFSGSAILLVVREHTRSVDLTGNGSVLLTKVKSDTGGFTSFISETLLGSEPSRFNQGSLATLHQQATAADPGYLRQDEFVLVEVFYQHRSITGFLGMTLPIYSYALMPVSAPS